MVIDQHALLAWRPLKITAQQLRQVFADAQAFVSGPLRGYVSHVSLDINSGQITHRHPLVQSYSICRYSWRERGRMEWRSGVGRVERSETHHLLTNSRHDGFPPAFAGV